MTTQAQAKHFRWNDIPLEQLRGTITRRFVAAENLMVAHVHFKRGDHVPCHAHVSEQITWVISGALRFHLGEQGEHELLVRAGELVVIPSNLPHRADALEDTLEVDIFSPPRRDWLEKTDDYLRG